MAIAVASKTRRRWIDKVLLVSLCVLSLSTPCAQAQGAPLAAWSNQAPRWVPWIIMPAPPLLLVQDTARRTGLTGLSASDALWHASAPGGVQRALGGHEATGVQVAAPIPVEPTPPSRICVKLRVDVADKRYDGSDQATVTRLLLSGVRAGDDVFAQVDHAFFESAKVGHHKRVWAIGVRLVGADAGRYQLPSSILQSVASIMSVPESLDGHFESKQCVDDAEQCRTRSQPALDSGGSNLAFLSAPLVIAPERQDPTSDQGAASWDGCTISSWPSSITARFGSRARAAPRTAQRA